MRALERINMGIKAAAFAGALTLTVANPEMARAQEITPIATTTETVLPPGPKVIKKRKKIDPLAGLFVIGAGVFLAAASNRRRSTLL